MHPNEPKLVKMVGILTESSGKKSECIETTGEFSELFEEAFDKDRQEEFVQISYDSRYGRALEEQLQKQAQEYINANK